MNPIPGSLTEDGLSSIPAGKHPPLKKRLPQAAWLLALALLISLLVHGYSWELGAENQPLQVPQIERLSDPSLFPGDPLVETLGKYRSVLFPVVATLKGWIPIERQFLLLHLLTTVAAAVAMWAVARLLTGSRGAALISTLILLCSPTIRPTGLGMDTSVAAWVTPTTLSFPILLAALYYLLGGRMLRAGIMAGIASLLNPVTAGLFLLVAGPVVLGEPRPWRRALDLVLGFALAGLPSLLVLPPQALIRGRGLDFLELLHRYYPYHFFASAHSAGEYLRLVILIGAAVAGFRALPDHPAARRAYRLVASVALILVIGAFFVDVVPIAAAAQLHLLRADRWFLVLLFAVAGGLIVRAGSGRDRWQLAGAIALFAGFLRAAYPILAWGALVLLLPHPKEGRLRLLHSLFAVATAAFAIERLVQPICLASVALLVGLVLLALAAGPRTMALLTTRHRGLIAAGVIALLDLALHNGTLGTGGIDLARPVLHPAWRDVQEWAAASTPVEAVFLTPPDYAGFRVYGQRGTVVERKDGAAMLWNPAFGPGWWERTRTVHEAITSGDAASLFSTARRYGARWIVVPVETAPPEPSAAYENERFKVYPVEAGGAKWSGEEAGRAAATP